MSGLIGEKKTPFKLKLQPFRAGIRPGIFQGLETVRMVDFAMMAKRRAGLSIIYEFIRGKREKLSVKKKRSDVAEACLDERNGVRRQCTLEIELLGKMRREKSKRRFMNALKKDLGSAEKM